MAFVRLQCFPSTSHFSTPQLPLFSQTTANPSLPKTAQSNNAFFPHLSSLSLSASQFHLFNTLSTETQKPTASVFSASFSVQAQDNIETLEIEERETGVEEYGEEVEEDEVPKTRVLAQNVPWTSTADDIRRLFEKYGTVVDVELSMHNKTRNRGLAFVSMSSPEEAFAALTNLESFEFEGRILKLTWATPKKEKSLPVQQSKRPAPIHNLFVANLPFQARANDLKEFFNTENGNAVSAEIIFYENPRGSAGYGFVSFNTNEEAKAALTTFQGKLFMGRPIRVARSKKFLRKETIATIQSEKAAEKSIPPERSEEAEEA